MKSSLISAIGIIAISVSMSSSICSADDKVTYFDKPPTPDELAKALKGSSKGKPSGLSGRGIEWTGDSSSGQGPQTPTEYRQLPADNSPLPEAGPAVAIPVNFDLGSSEINSSSLPYIDAIAAALVRDPALKLTVEGHTDSSGDSRKNLMLSWERAFTVFRVLVNRYRIDPNRLRPEGKGAQEPIQGMAPSNGINRRVQFRPM